MGRLAQPTSVVSWAVRKWMILPIVTGRRGPMMSRRQNVTSPPGKRTAKQIDETQQPRCATPPRATIRSIPSENAGARPTIEAMRSKTVDVPVRIERALAPIVTVPLRTEAALTTR